MPHYDRRRKHVKNMLAATHERLKAANNQANDIPLTSSGFTVPDPEWKLKTVANLQAELGSIPLKPAPHTF